MLTILEIRESDVYWVKELFKLNKGILGSFDTTYFRFKQSVNNREKWIVIPEIAFVHYMERLDGVKVIYEIAVNPSEKKKGIGRMLMAHIGYPIQLKTDADNLESNEFYKKTGYICLGQKKSKNGKKTFNIYQKWP